MKLRWLIVGAIVLSVAAVSFLAGLYYAPTELGSPQEERKAESEQEVFSSFGIVAGSVGAVAGDGSEDEEPLPDGTLAMGADFLSKLTKPAAGHLVGIVQEIDLQAGTIVVNAQRFEVVDESAESKKIRSLQSESQMTLHMPPGSPSSEAPAGIAKGDVVSVDVEVRPASGSNPAAIVITAIQNMSRQ